MTISRYDDIIHLKRPKTKHKKMSRTNRSAQFAPFDALSGHGEAISESNKLTFKKIDLSQDKKDILNMKLKEILSPNFDKEVVITYFVFDYFRDGGEYNTIKEKIVGYDEIYSEIKLENGSLIKIKNLFDLDY